MLSKDDAFAALTVAMSRIGNEMSTYRDRSNTHLAKMYEATSFETKAVEGSTAAGCSGFHDGLRRAVEIIAEELGISDPHA